MAKRKKKFDPLKEYTETRKFISPTTGDAVTVVRGMGSVNHKYILPHNMSGKDFRAWQAEMKEVVKKYCNFELKGDVNCPDTEDEIINND